MYRKRKRKVHHYVLTTKDNDLAQVAHLKLAELFFSMFPTLPTEQKDKYHFEN